MKNKYEGIHFFDCPEDEQQRRLEQYKRSQYKTKNFIKVFMILFIIIHLIIILGNKISAQSLNLGKLDTLQSSGSFTLKGDLPKWSTIRPSGQQYIQINHFYLIMYSSDSVEYRLEIPIQELPTLIKLMDSILRKNNINSKLIKNDKRNL